VATMRTGQGRGRPRRLLVHTSKLDTSSPRSRARMIVAMDRMGEVDVLAATFG
jgi:hypothetical protein